MSTQKNEPRALALGVSCYVIWGFFPLYFSLLSPAGAVEVIVHRAVWGLFFCLVALALTGSLGKIRALIADRGALWRHAGHRVELHEELQLTYARTRGGGNPTGFPGSSELSVGDRVLSGGCG